MSSLDKKHTETAESEPTVKPEVDSDNEAPRRPPPAEKAESDDEGPTLKDKLAAVKASKKAKTPPLADESTEDGDEDKEDESKKKPKKSKRVNRANRTNEQIRTMIRFHLPVNVSKRLIYSGLEAVHEANKKNRQPAASTSAAAAAAAAGGNEDKGPLIISDNAMHALIALLEKHIGETGVRNSKLAASIVKLEKRISTICIGLALYQSTASVAPNYARDMISAYPNVHTDSSVIVKIKQEDGDNTDDDDDVERRVANSQHGVAKTLFHANQLAHLSVKPKEEIIRSAVADGYKEFHTSLLHGGDASYPKGFYRDMLYPSHGKKDGKTDTPVQKFVAPKESLADTLKYVDKASKKAQFRYRTFVSGGRKKTVIVKFSDAALQGFALAYSGHKLSPSALDETMKAFYVETGPYDYSIMKMLVTLCEEAGRRKIVTEDVAEVARIRGIRILGGEFDTTFFHTYGKKSDKKSKSSSAHSSPVKAKKKTPSPVEVAKPIKKAPPKVPSKAEIAKAISEQNEEFNKLHPHGIMCPHGVRSASESACSKCGEAARIKGIEKIAFSSRPISSSSSSSSSAAAAAAVVSTAAVAVAAAEPKDKVVNPFADDVVVKPKETEAPPPTEKKNKKRKNEEKEPASTTPKVVAPAAAEAETSKVDPPAPKKRKSKPPVAAAAASDATTVRASTRATRSSTRASQ